MIKLAKKKSKSHWVEIDNVKFLVDYPTNSQEIVLNEIMLDNSVSENIRQLRYARKYLKYVIKDWEGIEEKAIIINNELDKELWEALTVDSVQTLTIFGKIYEELNVTDNDKKKL